MHVALSSYPDGHLDGEIISCAKILEMLSLSYSIPYALLKATCNVDTVLNMSYVLGFLQGVRYYNVIYSV